MNWYLQNGKDSDIIMSTRVRLSRNIKGIPFVQRCNEKELKNVYVAMQKAAPMIGYGLRFISLKDIEKLDRDVLVEKHIISQEFSLTKNPYAAIIINDEENICIEINEEDHIKLQVFGSGQELENLMNLAIEIDEKIEDLVSYSYSEKYGYLTACPTNVGTGLKVSVLAHLPALSITGNIRKVISIINNLGMNIKSLYGEGDVYQISNNQTLGITEKEITKNLKLISQKIIEQERTARKFLGKKEIELADKVYRDFGIFTNARKLSEEETRKLLSNVKLGTDLGIIDELNDSKISELILKTKSANLQKQVGNILSKYEQEIERAKIVKEIIASDNN